jgi:phytoene synthase
LTNFDLYNSISNNCSKSIAKNYSTSFYNAIQLLHEDLQQPICNIYGFVRLADEIVDTFHDYNKEELFNQFKQDSYKAIEQKISLNPVLHSFQQTVNTYKIDVKLIEAFLYSMELDLNKKQYTQQEYEQYIFGSAEAVGLMCLYIFCDGNEAEYQRLYPFAKKLGAAFQKVNFLRDIKADNEGLQRMYFPNCNFKNFTEQDKKIIEADIQSDFDEALIGIRMLPSKARFGVFITYKFYLALFKRIKEKTPQKILNERIRIADYVKAMIVANASLKYKLKLY